MVKDYEVHKVFQKIERRIQKNILYLIFIVVFYEVLTKVRFISNPFKYLQVIFVTLSFHKKIFMSKYFLWWLFIFIIIFHVFIIRYTSSLSQVLNYDGVVLKDYLDHKF